MPDEEKNHRAWNRDYLFLLLVVLSLQWRGAVRQSSSFMFNQPDKIRFSPIHKKLQSIYFCEDEKSLIR